MLQTIARNRASDAAAGAISIDLNEWRIRQGDKVRGLKLKESWDAEWGDDQVSAASRIAFRWATFPTRQTFEPAGDYNLGYDKLWAAARKPLRSESGLERGR